VRTLTSIDYNGFSMASDSRVPVTVLTGFLGSGKTTSVARLARHLTDQGLKVGLITNDQGSELVDTANGILE